MPKCNATAHSRKRSMQDYKQTKAHTHTWRTRGSGSARGLPPRSAPPASGLSGLSGSERMLLLLASSCATSRVADEWRCIGIGSTPLPLRGRPLPARGSPDPWRTTAAELRERGSGAAASSSMEPSRLAPAAEALNTPLRKSRREVKGRECGDGGGDAAATAAAAGRRGLTAATAAARARVVRGRVAAGVAALAVWLATARGQAVIVFASVLGGVLVSV